MSKTTKQTADAFSIPAFDATAVTDQVREFTEKGVAQSKEAYAKIQDQAEAAQKTLETTLETAQSNTAATPRGCRCAARRRFRQTAMFDGPCRGQLLIARHR